MPLPSETQVVTANALLDGNVVYLSADDRWVSDLCAAEVISNEAHAQIRLLDALARPDLVVGPYLAPVSLVDGMPRAAHIREQFRATGPSLETFQHSRSEQA